MNKKISYLAISVFIILGLSIPVFNLTTEYKPLKPMSLNYSYDSLEPYIDKETMYLHYNKHYKTYLEKYNNVIKKYPDLYSQSIESILKNLDSMPEKDAIAIKNNGGGIINHELFFKTLSPKNITPSDELLTTINRDFGSFDNFKKQFKESALSVFGSGWAWLVSDNNGKLSIITTANQDSPITSNLYPILGIDVWEHAYYLLYQNNRGNYIDNWFNVIDWNEVYKIYKSI